MGIAVDVRASPAAEVQAAIAAGSFDLALVSTAVAEVPLEPLLNVPTPGEQVAQVLRVAALTERAADRVGLLQAALTLVGEAGPTIPEAQARRWQQEARMQDARMRRASCTPKRSMSYDNVLLIIGATVCLLMPLLLQ